MNYKNDLIIKNNNSEELNKEESIRISILKVWLTIMVLYIHSYSETINFVDANMILDISAWLDIIKYVLSQVVSRCAVPAFFFISAYLLYKKDFSWKINIRKKVKTLIIPYIILNTLWIILFFIFQNISVTSAFFSNADNIISNWTVIDWLDAYLGFKNSCPILYPLWFLRDLFVLNLLSSVFNKIIKKIPKTTIFILLFLWIFIESSPVFFLNIQAICFWGFGCFFAKQKKSLLELDKMKKI